jgi:hypothetical protein
VFLVFLDPLGVINLGDCDRLRRFEPRTIEPFWAGGRETIGSTFGSHRFRKSLSASHLTIDPKGVWYIVAAAALRLTHGQKNLRSRLT